jgi:xylulokinase
VIEGVSFGLADVFDLVSDVVPGINEIRLGGGGAKAKLWRQMLADILGRELVSMSVEEGPAHGAALLAAVSQHAYSTIEEACDAIVKPSQRTAPSTHAPRYKVSREIYQSLYPTLRPAMHQLSRA